MASYQRKTSTMALRAAISTRELTAELSREDDKHDHQMEPRRIFALTLLKELHRDFAALGELAEARDSIRKLRVIARRKRGFSSSSN